MSSFQFILGTACVLTALGQTSAVAAPVKYGVHARHPLGGEGGWDYIHFDAKAQRLYVSHETRVEVVDATTGKQVGTIPDTPGVHGIVTVPAAGLGFTTNGRENKVSVFNLKTLELVRKIEVGKGPDGIYHDSASNRIFTNNHGSHDITALNATTGEVVGTLVVGGDGEQMITATNGLLYVNLEDTSEVVAFDPYKLEVRHRFPISGAKTPTGLAYDAEHNRLLIGCRSQRMVVMNAADGSVLQSFPIGAGIDAAAFDNTAKLAFFSNGDGTLNIFRALSTGTYKDAGVVKTLLGAKTLVYDQRTRRIFLPVADVEMIPAADPAGKPRRKVKPGTFSVLVLAPE